jgi:hypothetical protein
MQLESWFLQLYNLSSHRHAANRLASAGFPYMTRLLTIIHSRLNSGAWALAALVIIEVLSNFLSESLTIGHLTPNEVLLPRSYLYTYWVAFIVLLLAVVAVLWLRNDRRRLRWAIFAVNSLFTAQHFSASLLQNPDLHDERGLQPN